MQVFFVRVDARGRVTIPKPIREALGIVPETLLEVTVTGSALVLRPIRSAPRRDFPRR